MSSPVSAVPLSEEARRLAALERYAILDTDFENSFDRLTRVTARLFQVPSVLISLVTEGRQWFKSCYGLGQRELDWSTSFCTHALESDEIMVVLDAVDDGRSVETPRVVSEPQVRFFAGAPLITMDGHRLGTLCILDTEPHTEFTAAEQTTLLEMAASVVSEMELRATLADRRHSEAVNAAILMSSPDAIITLDAQGMITEWNPAAERMLGYSRAEVLGRSSQLLVSEVNGEATGEMFWAFLQTQAVQQTDRFVVPINNRGGTTFSGEIAFLTLEVNGERMYTLVVRDLTVQEASRAALSSQRNLLRAVLDGVPEAVYVKDLEYRYLMINVTGAAHLGLPVEAILGKTDEEVLPTVTAAASRLRDEQVLRGGERITYEVTDLLPDGSTRVYWSNKTVYQDGTGRTAGLIGVSMDITERRKAEAIIQRHNERLTRRVEQAQLEILERLARAAEYRDDDTGEHMLRVGTTAASLAHELGLPETEVELIRQTAPLHDVGKIGVSDGILLKPGRLTAEEFEVVKTHSEIGAGILRGGRSPLVQMAETIARTHHERWDGSGYPAGLAGEEIPLVGRIVAVADVLDALTSERPYKLAWSLPAAIAEIETQAGRQFDPQVVTALLRMYSGTERTARPP